MRLYSYKGMLCVIIMGCLLAGGCGQKPADKSPSPSPAETLSAPLAIISQQESPPAESPEAANEEINDNAWKNNAQKLHAVHKSFEYYFDTDEPVSIGDEDDYPLYKRNTEDGETVYTGITGYFFTASDKYLYVQSDIEIGDNTVYQTRILSMDDGAVYPVEKDAAVLVVPGVKKVYYSKLNEAAIYIADPLAKNAKKIKVKLPDIKTISEKAGYGGLSDNLAYNIAITRVEDGFIYFNCTVADVSLDTLYTGGYRIRSDGKNIEKTDEGKISSGFSD